jgi:uncharacterized phage protein gp47/JayE
MSTIPFQRPDFLNEDEETIHQRMLANAPPDINVSEGEPYYDATRPVAIEKAIMIDMQLENTIKIAFPQWSYNTYLDMHAEMRGLRRKAPTKSTGIIRLTGSVGTLIPKGTIVTTVSDGENPAIEFQTTEDAEIGPSGQIDVPIVSVLAGTKGNVIANSIVLLAKSIDGITSVTNPDPTSGGTEGEDDESLRQRILEADKDIPLSGAKSDYARWAKDVPGVGEAYVIPEWNGPGTVKVIIIDANGGIPSQQLINDVQNYIAPPDGDGKAPLGATVTVAGPNQRSISVTFSWALENGADSGSILQSIDNEIRSYFMSVPIGGNIRIAKIGAIIINQPGVVDYNDLKLNGAADNIQLGPDEKAVLIGVTAS